eukprot:CAMPEP_0174727092 /NCGR_PEP_ID=MMETSP1094-20130205/49060_1 /TAXON_ID=156173 /ORGANISM="Chrysochromulina brevifilum, Strain UTEX LB 985" /LENGTH=46 /DNA_ID= /DNA_START= /DNA_END= /DNA_ORIENTATION=
MRSRSYARRSKSVAFDLAAATTLCAPIRSPVGPLAPLPSAESTPRS